MWIGGLERGWAEVAEAGVLAAVTLRILEDEPGRLVEVSGVGPKRTVKMS